MKINNKVCETFSSWHFISRRYCNGEHEGIAKPPNSYKYSTFYSYRSRIDKKQKIRIISDDFEATLSPKEFYSRLEISDNK